MLPVMNTLVRDRISSIALPRICFLVVASCTILHQQARPEVVEETCAADAGGHPVSLVQVRSARSKRLPRRHHRLHEVEEVDSLVGWQPWASDQDMKVVYGVFTSPLPKYAHQLAAVEETWGKDVAPQKLLIVGVNGSTPGVAYKQAPICKDGHVTNPGISCKEATLLSTGYELGADWVVVIGSDNYVFPRHVETQLLKKDANEAQILGVFGCGEGKYCEDHKGGICGGAGYAISRGALDKMVGKAESAAEAFVQESMETARNVAGYWSDQVTSCIARRRGVKEVQLANLYGWQLCDRGFQCAFNETAYRNKIMSSHNQPLTFHYIEPREMHKIHEMAHDLEAGVSLFDYQDEMELAGMAHDLEMADEAAIQREMAGQVSLTSLQSSVVENTYEVQRKEYIEMMDKEVYHLNASLIVYELKGGLPL